jgi:hypothetical protein
MKMTDKEMYQVVKVCLQGVAACFNSRTESSTCINDHHPSCLEYVNNVLEQVEEAEAQRLAWCDCNEDDCPGVKGVEDEEVS